MIAASASASAFSAFSLLFFSFNALISALCFSILSQSVPTRSFGAIFFGFFSCAFLNFLSVSFFFLFLSFKIFSFSSFSFFFFSFIALISALCFSIFSQSLSHLLESAACFFGAFSCDALWNFLEVSFLALFLSNNWFSLCILDNLFFSLIALISALCFSILLQSLSHLLLSAFMTFACFSCVSFHLLCDSSILCFVSSSTTATPFSSASNFAIRCFSLIALISALCCSILSQSLSHLLLSAFITFACFSCVSFHWLWDSSNFSFWSSSISPVSFKILFFSFNALISARCCSILS